MRTSTKLLGSIAVAGLVAAAGSAFTGGGVTVNSPTQFIGGTVSQTVTGAHVNSVVYAEGTTAPGTGTYQKSVTLTFAEAHAAGTVSVHVNDAGSAIPCDVATGNAFTCVLDGGSDAGVLISSLAITATA